MGYHILYNDYVKNNNYGGDEHYYVYQVETNDGFFVLKYGEEVVKYIKRTIIKKEQNNLKGGLTHTSKIMDKPVEICDAIVFKKCYKYQREDKPFGYFWSRTDKAPP